MKNDKLKILALSAFMFLFGCQSQEKRDQKFADNFANYLLQRANTEMLKSLTPDERNGIGQTKISGGASPYHNCHDATPQDSALYADAIKKYADVALVHRDGARNYGDIWKSIQQADRYEYGPGSFINENKQWEYGDSVLKGASKELRVRANYEAYQQTIKALYIARQARNRRK